MHSKLIPMSVLGGLLLATVSVASAQSAPKIGVFDPFRVSEESVVGKQIAAELQGYFDKKQSELNGLQETLVELQKQAQAQALSLSDAKRSELNREIQRKTLELTSARDAATRELQLEQSEAENRFQQQLLRVVQVYGKREGFLLILDRNQVVWSADTIDVTTAIVDLFDELVKPEGDGG